MASIYFGMLQILFMSSFLIYVMNDFNILHISFGRLFHGMSNVDSMFGPCQNRTGQVIYFFTLYMNIFKSTDFHI